MDDSPRNKQTLTEDKKSLNRSIQELGQSESKRKQLEARLRTSEEWQRTILQTAMDGFWMADLQGRLLEVNETYCRMSGYSEQELLTMRIPDLEVVESVDDTAAHVQKLIAQGEERFESQHRRKDGSIFYVELSVQYRPIEGGRFVAFLRDITERKMVENELKESEEKFRTIFDKASDGILIADPITKKFLQGNATIESKLGYTVEEIGHLTINDIHPPNDIPHVLDEFEKQRKGEKVLAEAIPVLRKDGSVFYADIGSKPITIGGIVYLLGIFHDITERKRAAERLKTARDFLDAVLDNLMDPLIVIDTADYSISRANKAFIHSCGLNADTVVGKRCYELNHCKSTPCDRPDDLCPLAETLKTGQQSIVEHIHYDSAGIEHYVTISTVPIINKRDEIRQIIHISRDITPRKQAEQALRQQREEFALVSRLATVGEFAASIAHEIHQPLTAILNNAQAAQRFLSSNRSDAIAEVRDALTDIISDNQRAANVINHLRAFLKSKEPDRTILDINTVIEEVLTMIHGELIDRHVYVNTELSPEIPPVEGYRVGLQQVLMNLILNACDSMLTVEPKRRRMHIRTSTEEPNNMMVAIQDSGTGLDTNEIDRVFDQFFTTKREGLGMGLSISKSIIAAHGGRIWAVNNHDCGATFLFTLPIYKKKAG